MTGPGPAVRAVLRQRRPDPACWDAVVDAVCTEGPSYGAEQVLVQAGAAVARHADRIARDLRRQQGLFGTAVGHGVAARALALVGAGDLRALPALHRLAERGGLPYMRREARIMAALPPAELTAVMLTKLRRDGDGHHGKTTTLDLLALCGAAAAPATAGRLAAYATTRDPVARRPRARRAAWAHWKVTGDPTLALDVCGATVGAGTASHGLPFLADLGPLAAVHAEAVRRLMESPGAWTRTYAAYAYWRITGDPEPAVPVLLAEVDPDWDGDPALPVREAVRILGEIGAPAVSVAPLLRRILAQEERLGRPWDGVRILADQAYVRTLTEALEGIDGWGK
ncbi:hypothetical protein [Streptomyces yangpuensis]|uniref:hypothetical protein n=1 Tax=Streptomyces yangpuensis TaxID=1648182 RepID=UPI0038046F1D